MNEWLLPVLVAIFGSAGLWALVLAFFNRKWTKEDKKEEKEDETTDNTKSIEEINQKLDGLIKVQDVLVRAQKVSLAHDINDLGICHIYAKEITIEEKRTITEMHNSYEELVNLDPNGENGLCTVMDEVNKLKVVPKHKSFTSPGNTTKTPAKKKRGEKE